MISPRHRETQSGAFVVFEGIDGSGKSTQIRYLTAHMRSVGERVHATAEPTASPIGMLIRNAFARRISMDDRTIAALFVADRIDHLTNREDGLLGLLARGINVVSDRYHLSSHAYHTDDVGAEWVEYANSLSTRLLIPDLTIYLELDPDDSIRRIERSTVIPDRFEHRARLASAFNNYSKAIAKFSDRDHIVTLDAKQSPTVLAEQIWQYAKPLLLDSGGHKDVGA